MTSRLSEGYGLNLSARASLPAVDPGTDMLQRVCTGIVGDRPFAALTSGTTAPVPKAIGIVPFAGDRVTGVFPGRSIFRAFVIGLLALPIGDPNLQWAISDAFEVPYL